jgi:hypothetical protein
MSHKRWIATTAVSLVLGAVLGAVVVTVSVATADAPQAPRVGTMTAGPAVPRSLP